MVHSGIGQRLGCVVFLARTPFLARISRFQLSSSNCATTIEYTNDHDSYKDITNSNNTIRRRPRLQALREQLRKDVVVPSNMNPRKQDSNSSRERPNVVVDQSLSSSRRSISLFQQQQQQQQQQQHIEEEDSVLKTTVALADDPSAVLMDRFGRQHTYLRLSLTERCNLRCTYCMPENGLPELPPYLLSTSQLLSIAQYFHSRGVKKFRLTGGEPTLRPDLVDIVSGLRQLSADTVVGMTTNGIALNERRLIDLEQAGLTHLNISLDTLDPDQFAKITRRPYFPKVWKTLEQAVQRTNLSVKLNCVVQRNVNQDQVAPMIRLLSTFPNLQIRFIEYMPFADNAWSYDQCVPYRELLDDVTNNNPDIQLQAIPSDDPHDTTKWYQELNNHTGTGKIGFITSMSQHFCASCNRLRVTADGLLKVCLFDTEKRTIDLRQALVDQIPLDQVVGPTVQRKHKALGGHGTPVSLGQSSAENRPMTRIGG